MAADFTFEWKRFLGLRDSQEISEEWKDAESPEMLNFKITDAYQLKKRDGYFTILDEIEPIRGIWCGEIAGKRYFLEVVGEEFFASETSFDAVSLIEGTVPGQDKVFFFPFYKAVYLLTGHGILQFDGSVLSPLEPYVPLVMISTTPQGSGVTFEEANLLTPKIRQSFSPTGQDEQFNPVIRAARQIDWVKKDGVLLSEDDYYWDEAVGALIFAQVPKAGTDTVEMQYEPILSEETKDRILNCRFALGFGGGGDTRAFLYGNKDSPAVRYHSGIVDGTPSMRYFPATAYTLVGTGSPITAILQHYDRQLIFTEHAAYFSYLEYLTGENQKLIASFPVFSLSGERGCAPEGQALLIENTPCTLDDAGLFRWVSTNIRDERNALCFSDPIARSLRKHNASDAILFHRKRTSELYVYLDPFLYVYRYDLGVFYLHEIPGILGFCEVENELYFYTDHRICQVGGESDDGSAISARWHSAMLSFGETEKQKRLFRTALAAKTGEEAKVKIAFRRENGELEGEKNVIFGAGEEFSHREISSPLRRFRLLQVCLSADGTKPFQLLRLSLRGRITDENE